MEEGKWKWNVRWEVNRIRVSVMCVSCVCHVCVMCGVGCTPVLLLLIVVHCIHKFACNRTVNECQIIHKQHTLNQKTKQRQRQMPQANAIAWYLPEFFFLKQCFEITEPWCEIFKSLRWENEWEKNHINNINNKLNMTLIIFRRLIIWIYLIWF